MVSPVVIVGAGLAGLACAQDLSRAGIECQVLEASDGVGGRVRTDAIDGFLLDRGFQVLFTAYPEVVRRLDVDALDLQTFEPGAVLRIRGGFHHIADPRRKPMRMLSTLTAPIGTLADKARLLRLVVDVRFHTAVELLRRPDMTTADRLSPRQAEHDEGAGHRVKFQGTPTITQCACSSVKAASFVCRCEA